jgi:hypothetical protein
MPYTYLIGWSKTNKYYYGVRYSKHCSPTDLWNTYFTSSKVVKEYVLQHGDPDIIQIRKVFKNSNDARVWEEKVLKRIKASTRNDFLNKSNGASIPVECCTLIGEKNGMFGKKHTFQTLNKLRAPKSEKHKEHMRGKRPHFNQSGSNNNAFKGYVITPYGKFDSLEMAARAENVSGGTIHYRIKSNQEKFKNYRRVS